MVTPYDEPELKDQWRHEVAARLADGFGMHAICTAIARRHGCSAETVYRHVDDAYAEADRRRVREYNARLRANQKSRLASLLVKPSDGQNDRCGAYTRAQYVAARRACRLYLDQFLARAFEGYTIRHVAELAESMAITNGGVRFRPGTIQRWLHRYADGQQAGTIRGPPYLTAVEPGRWRYSYDPELRVERSAPD